MQVDSDEGCSADNVEQSPSLVREVEQGMASVKDVHDVHR